MNNLNFKSHDMNVYHGFFIFTNSLHDIYMYSTIKLYSYVCKAKPTNLRGKLTDEKLEILYDVNNDWISTCTWCMWK